MRTFVLALLVPVLSMTACNGKIALGDAPVADGGPALNDDENDAGFSPDVDSGPLTESQADSGGPTFALDAEGVASTNDAGCPATCNGGCDASDECLVDCTASNACADGAIECPAGMACKFSCGDSGCSDETFRCFSGSCTFTCGTAACNDSQFDCGAGGCTIACNGATACDDSTFNNGTGGAAYDGSGSVVVQCSGSTSCQDSTFHNAGGSFVLDCSGDGACQASQLGCGTGVCDATCPDIANDLTVDTSMTTQATVSGGCTTTP